MNRTRKSRRFLGFRLGFISGLALGLWLFTLALATFPKLHECLHADARDSKHECVVTAVMHGKVDIPELAAIQLQAVYVEEVALPAWQAPWLCPVPYRFPQSHAPPASSPLA